MRDFCFFEEIFHFWFKTQPINTITSPSRSQDGELVRNLLVYLDNWKRWSELPIGSSSFQDVLANQLFYLLTLFYVYSGVLSLPVMRLVCLAEPSFRTCRLLLRIQSKISSPWVWMLKWAPQRRLFIQVFQDNWRWCWLDGWTIWWFDGVGLTVEGFDCSKNTCRLQNNWLRWDNNFCNTNAVLRSFPWGHFQRISRVVAGNKFGNIALDNRFLNTKEP